MFYIYRKERYVKITLQISEFEKSEAVDQIIKIAGHIFLASREPELINPLDPKILSKYLD